jgi:hypothetical protein
MGIYHKKKFFSNKLIGPWDGGNQFDSFTQQKKDYSKMHDWTEF